MLKAEHRAQSTVGQAVHGAALAELDRGGKAVESLDESNDEASLRPAARSS